MQDWVCSISYLKLVRTVLNYRVLGTSTATAFLSKWSFSPCTYIPRMDVMLDFICIGPADLPGGVESYKNTKWKVLAHSGTRTHKSCACCQHANTRSGRMFGCVCMLETSTGLVCLFAICKIFIIFQYVTQNSTFTRKITLHRHFVILVLVTMNTLVSGVHVCDKVI